jgi:hypothetical protein
MPFGVNASYAADAQAEFSKFNAADCPPLGCPWQPCPLDAVPVCENGACTWQPGCSARSEADCESDGQCEAYTGTACGSSASGFITCGKLKGACDDALTCASGPYQGQFMFTDGCIPEGWTACTAACN